VRWGSRAVAILSCSAAGSSARADALETDSRSPRPRSSLGCPFLAAWLVCEKVLRDNSLLNELAKVPGLRSKRRKKETARFVEPMQCLPVAKLPESSNWEYEVKFDGYRALGIKSGGRVRLMSRNQNDLASRFPILAEAFAELPDETIIDGEIVALDETGRPSFNVLQNYRRAGTPLQFYAFDVVTFAGRSLQDQPLEERRKVLRTKILPRMSESVLFSETLEATGPEVIEAVKAQGLEGVIAKRRDSLYEPGRRSGAWVKMRVNKARELIVGGYVANGKNFDSIVVGFYERDDLVYVARVRNGFTPSLRDAVLGTNRGENARMPMAQASANRANRIRRMDRRQPPASFEVRRAYHLMS
jgi:DNA ligase D-like protein (predicted ligase)